MGVTNDNVYVAVIDDDESICRSLERLLRASGFQAVSYSSAESFLRDAKQPRFDCLLLDVQLDGMSGLELRKHLNAAGSRIPVLFITAHDDPESRAAAIASGCEGYFRKTSLGAEILAAIRSAVERNAAAMAQKSASPATPFRQSTFPQPKSPPMA